MVLFEKLATLGGQISGRTTLERAADPGGEGVRDTANIYRVTATCRVVWHITLGDGVVTAGEEREAQRVLSQRPQVPQIVGAHAVGFAVWPA